MSNSVKLNWVEFTPSTENSNMGMAAAVLGYSFSSQVITNCVKSSSLP